MPFTSLPLELKQEIWQLAVHAAAAEPEVCILWPLRQTHFNQVSTRLLVDTAFPVLMHVCREWRAFVLSWCERPRSSPSSGFSEPPIRFRFSRQAGCRVPYRRFRGGADALYASTTNFEKTLQMLAVDWEPHVGREVLATVRHLAVDYMWWGRAAYWLPELVFRGCPDLKKVSVVFPSSRRAMWNAFQAPARRCKLRRVEGAEGLVAERDPERRPGEMWSVQWHVDNGRVTAEHMAVFTWSNDVAVHELDMGEPGGQWFVGSAWDKEREKLCVEAEAAAFVQYKRSGDGGESWVEACKDRLLVRGEDGKMQQPPVPSPEQCRRNPEEWRVNDEDDYQF
jgi:hypothetical protein